MRILHDEVPEIPLVFVPRYFTPVMLIVFLSLHGFVKLTLPVYKSPKPEHMPEEYRADLWPLCFVAFAFLHNRRFGLLFALGLLAEVAFQLVS